MSDTAAARADEGGKVGMWLFISTEVVLFGGLFLLYAMYRLKHPAEFHAGAMELSRFFGTFNTCILITSSFSLVLAVAALRTGRRRETLGCLGATILLALGFLTVKAFEWGAKFEHGLYPGSRVLSQKPHGEALYFGLYFTMTGLHAIHVFAGILVLSWVFLMVRRGVVSPQRPLLLENSGLYWHLVDIFWIFLFPLFYLIT